MASPFTELEVLTIMFSLLVFALLTLTGILREDSAYSNAVQMELPFSSFELTFIIIAFVIFSLFSLASICVQPQEEKGAYVAEKSRPLNRKQRVITKQAGKKP